jgi:isochorismate pyruvate lyase
MKKPKDCLDMKEIREMIDIIDKGIISQLGLRYEYVKAAAQFKTNEQAVKAPERFAAMLSQRRQWAEENNLNPDIIEKVYHDLVNYFISQELQHFNEKSTDTKKSDL